MVNNILIWLMLAISMIAGTSTIAESRASVAQNSDRQGIEVPVESVQWLDDVRPGPFLPDPILPEPRLPDPILPEPILPGPILPEPILPGPILPEPILPKPIVPEPILPKPIVPDPIEPRGVNCSPTSDWVNPRAQQLALEFGVSPDEILARFCQGHGFGEIKLAYSIAARLGIPVQDVFNQRDSGEGWGNIFHFYGIHGDHKNADAKPSRGRGGGRGNAP